MSPQLDLDKATVESKREYARQWRKANSDRIMKYRRRYWEEHRKEIQERARKRYRVKHPKTTTADTSVVTAWDREDV